MSNTVVKTLVALKYPVGTSLTNRSTGVGAEVAKVQSIGDNGQLFMDNGRIWYPTTQDIS